jgi:hypothetical protein
MLADGAELEESEGERIPIPLELINAKWLLYRKGGKLKLWAYQDIIGSQHLSLKQKNEAQNLLRLQARGRVHGRGPGGGLDDHRAALL